MSEIVDRNTFLYYLNNGDVNWEATARECITKAFELAEENAKLKDKNNDLIEEIASGNIDIAILQKDLELFRKAHDNEQAQRRIFEQKLESIKEITETALKANYCDNCDGVGIPECADYECHTYALDRIMNIIEGAEGE